MKINGLYASISALILVVATTTAQAATLNAQGASLPELAYTGNTESDFPATQAPKATSIFGAFNAASGHSVSYAGNGSGSGKTAIISGTSPFTGTDSPFTQTNYTEFTSGAGARIAPVQVPAIIGAVAVVYNLPNAPSLDISSADLAQIFEGIVKDWSEVPGSNSTGPIKLVGRSSASGTTFSFVNHLNAVNNSIKVTELLSGALPAGVSFVGQSNNAALVDYVKANVGSIGYAEAANAKALSVQTATVDGKSVTDLDSSFLNAGSILTDQVITGVDGNGAATVGPITGISAGKTGFIKLVNPSAYAYPSPTPSSYPIVAVSYLLSNTNANTDVAAVKAALAAPYNANYQAALGSNAYGFAFIPAPLAKSLTDVINNIQ